MSDKTILQKEEAITLSHTEVGGLRPGTLQLTFNEDVLAKSVHESLDRIFKLHGCIACGFLGLDIRLRVVDPIFRQFRDIEGVIDANMYR